MLALGFTTRGSGLDATLGLAFAQTGWLYPFFGAMLGWLGVALTGSDTSSNVLFGGLQKISAQQLGLSPVLMAAANSSGGVMGKMIDAQSIVVASHRDAVVRPRGRHPALRLLPQPGPGRARGPADHGPGLRVAVHGARGALMASEPGEPPGRLDAIDLVRGVVMVLMLLDHTREFTHADALVSDPLDLGRTTPLLFATRWVTHLCAPTFVFLAGLGVGLQRLRGKPLEALTRFLWTRGLWLIFLELTVVRSLMWFNWHPSLLAFLQVIWAIGVSLIVLAALVRLPVPLVGGLGVVIVLGHNLLDGIAVPGWRGPDSPVPSALAKLWIVLHQGGLFPIAGFPGPMVFAPYPILPWLGVLLAGYGAATLYALALERRKRALVGLGVAMLAAFVVLRFANVYGDPVPWTPQADFTKTVDVLPEGPEVPAVGPVRSRDPRTLHPRPRSARRAHDRGGLGGALVVFGRVPLFFYLLQWVYAHVAGMIVSTAWART